jgi:hypothetical protein
MTMAPETMPTAEDFAMMEDSDVAALSPLARAEYFQWRYEQEKTARQAAEKRASEGRAAPCPISEAQFAAEAPELPLVVFGQRIKTMRKYGKPRKNEKTGEMSGGRFESGAFGYWFGGQVTLTIAGEEVRFQFGGQMVAINSKDAKKIE